MTYNTSFLYGNRRGNWSGNRSE